MIDQPEKWIIKVRQDIADHDTDAHSPARPLAHSPIPRCALSPFRRRAMLSL